MAKQFTLFANTKATILREHGLEVCNFIQKHSLLDNSDSSILIETDSHIELKSLLTLNELSERTIQKLINVKRMNDVKFINKFLETSNEALSQEGLFFGYIETAKNRKLRILKKYPPYLNRLFYYNHFIVNRVLPKIRITKKMYFLISNGKNRVISEMEIYGRLYSCGFELLDSREINGNLWFAGRKRTAPAFNTEATYGPLIKLKRHGKNNELFNVYKLRTMYPFSEYLQEYISSKYGLQQGGKFNNDPRVTTAGRLFRKYWLDEIPMFFNLLKGEMKLFGVRPLSSHYLGFYPDHVKELRSRTKPGLIPPFYADLPSTLDEIIVSEEVYLVSYLKNPISTDIKYFRKAVYNILVKKARSN